MGLKIGLRESIGHFVQSVVDGMGSTIPEEERLKIVTNRVGKEVDMKRSRYQTALKEVIAMQNPDEGGKGKIPQLKARIKTLEAYGNARGKEHEATEDEDERAELMAKMQECSIEILALKDELRSLETAYQMWQETAALRRKAWQDAKAEYDQLRLQGKALVVQKAALSEATTEHGRAIQEAGGAKDNNVKSILAALREDLEEAYADNKAAGMVQAEGKTTNIEEEIEAGDRAGASQKMIATWVKA